MKDFSISFLKGLCFLFFLFKNCKEYCIVASSNARRDTTETIESGPLCTTDLFQNKSGLEPIFNLIIKEIGDKEPCYSNKILIFSFI